ncbi:MAG: calcium-binding protein, partial [Alphaproteobacteria bacterium]
MAGGDRIDLPVPNGGKPLAFAGFQACTIGGAGQQFGTAGDGYADVIWDQQNGRTRIAVDVNDDGLLTDIDQVILLDGLKTIQADDFNDVMTVVRGTTGADTVIGGNNGETFNTLGGNDIIDARGGNDIVNGGAGNDVIDGGLGSDTLNGEGDDDTIHGNDDGDTISGGDGNDTLFGDAGTDNLHGNNGVDSIDGGAGGDTVDGDSGADVLHGGADNDTVRG